VARSRGETSYRHGGARGKKKKTRRKWPNAPENKGQPKGTAFLDPACFPGIALSRPPEGRNAYRPAAIQTEIGTGRESGPGTATRREAFGVARPSRTGKGLDHRAWVGRSESPGRSRSRCPAILKIIF